MSGRPQPRSLQARIEAFYLAHPGEWLTYDDAALKFACTRAQLIAAIERLNKSGRLMLRVRSVVVRAAECSETGA